LDATAAETVVVVGFPFVAGGLAHWALTILRQHRQRARQTPPPTYETPTAPSRPVVVTGRHKSWARHVDHKYEPTIVDSVWRPPVA